MKYLSAIKNLMVAILQLDGDYIAKCWGWLVREAKYDIGRVRFVIDIGWYKFVKSEIYLSLFTKYYLLGYTAIEIISFQFIKFIFSIELVIKE